MYESGLGLEGNPAVCIFCPFAAGRLLVSVLFSPKKDLTSREEARERCTDESQVPSIVMTASRRVQLGARRGRSGHRLRGMLMDAR